MTDFFKSHLTIVLSLFWAIIPALAMDNQKITHEQIMRNILRNPCLSAQLAIAHNDSNFLEKTLAMSPFSLPELHRLFYEAVAHKKEIVGRLLQARYNLNITRELLEAAQESGYQFTSTHNMC